MGANSDENSAVVGWKRTLPTIAIVLLIGSCASKTRSTRQASGPVEGEPTAAGSWPEPARPNRPAATSGTARQEDRWWTGEAPCPPGAELVGAPPPNGVRIGCKTQKGVNAGPATAFHASGVKADEAHYRAHRAHGVLTEWDSQGNKRKEIEYVDGRKEGLETEWSPQGRVLAQRTYLGGKRNGPTRVWHPNGTQGLESPYVDGKQHGIETHWDDTGRVLKLIRWEDDRVVKAYPYKHGKPAR